MSSEKFPDPLKNAPMPRSFVWVASLLYLGVLCTGVYFSAAGLCAVSPTLTRLIPFVGVIALLLGLEQLAQRLYGSRWPTATAIGLLVARMVLLEVVAAVDC